MMLCLQQSGIVIVADVPESHRRKRDVIADIPVSGSPSSRHHSSTVPLQDNPKRLKYPGEGVNEFIESVS